MWCGLDRGPVDLRSMTGWVERGRQDGSPGGLRGTGDDGCRGDGDDQLERQAESGTHGHPFRHHDCPASSLRFRAHSRVVGQGDGFSWITSDEDPSVAPDQLVTLKDLFVVRPS